MTDTISNIAKGRFVELAKLGAANDALIAVPIEATGVESDATLQDYDDLAALLAGASNEQTTMGRKTVTGVTTSTNDTTNKQAVDFDDITWTGATGNDTAKLVVCYDQDTTGGTDSSLVPLFLLDFVTDPNGGDIVYQTPAGGVADAS